jgi:predicted nucleotidyltransferase
MILRVKKEDAINLVRTYRKLFKKAFIFGSVARDENDAWSDIDCIFIRNTSLPFPERGKELLSFIKASGGADVLVYTPSEFSRQLKKEGFIKEILKESIEIEGEQSGSGEMVETGGE